MKLEEFLEKKPLYYDKIDYERFPRIWQDLKDSFKLPKIIHIIGTNGKGSTGRFLARYLFESQKRVGHYSSPHILKFNERIWLNGSDVSDELLQEHHQKLQKILTKEQSDMLSYFEYTTLLAISIFEECEYVVLEAGLGGEYDATAVFAKDLTLVTPIGYDHESFLGDTLERIAKTKLNAVQKFAILGKQDKRVYKLAKEMSRKKGIEFFRTEFFFSKEEMAKARRLIRSLHLPIFFLDNLLLALAGAKFFGFSIKYQKLQHIKLFGRMQKIAPNITIDVGHNPLAAQAIVQAFSKKKITLIYNSYVDKEYTKVLEILKPIIQEVQILPIYNQRAQKEEILKETFDVLNIPYKGRFKEIDQSKEYLVFGSFSVVEEFLKYYAKRDKTT